jgi:hypothetical protein
MPYSIELFFDDATSTAISAAWKAMADVTESAYMVRNGVRPHIALAVMESFDDRICGPLTALAGETSAFSVAMSGVESFGTDPWVVFVGFACHGRLDAVHRRVQAVLSDLHSECHPHYTVGRWKPHCTLAMEFPKCRLSEAIAGTATMNLRLPYIVRYLGIVEYPPTRITWERPLTGQAPVADYGSQTRRT